MKLVSDSVRWMEDSAGTWLCIKTNRRMAVQACDEVKPGKEYDVKITQHRERRSLDANAYAWVLMDKLADHLSMSGQKPMTAEEVYRNYIPYVPGNYTIVPVKEGLVEHWDRIWCGDHLGRMTRDIGECKGKNLKGYRNVMSYMGSSDYDGKMMGRLIDLIIQDCKQYGIETLPPDRLEQMTREWGAAYA